MIGTELVKHYRQNTKDAGELHRLYTEVEAEARHARARIEARYAEARQELAAAYLPMLTRAAIDDVAKRAGFKKLQRMDPLKAMDHEVMVLKRRIATIQSDETYRRRQWLVGDNGELTRALEEARSMLAPWEESANRFESLPRFLELVEIGYDTPDFNLSWLDPRYWMLWAAGDAVCEALNMADFGDDVLPAYLPVRVERDKWQVEVKEAQEKVNAVHELVREHDKAVARIPRLPAAYLAASQDALAKFLETADVQLLAEWNEQHPEPDRAVTIGLRRIGGLQAKLRAIDELVQRGLAEMIHSLEARISKYKRKAVKFNREKHRHRRHDPRNADLKFRTKLDKYRQRVSIARVLVQRLDTYEDYEDFDIVQNDPELWFREMTGKRPTRLFPQTRAWYDRQANPRPVRAKRSAQRVAKAAAKASLADDLGYLS